MNLITSPQQVAQLTSKRTFVPSTEQQNFFDKLLNSTANLLLKASAGSGKTTTIVEACSLLPATAKILFLAFNKDIVTTLVPKLPKNAQAKTFHSLGLAAWKAHMFPRQVDRPDADKLFNILKRKLKDRKEQELYFGPACKLVSFAKNVGLGTHLADATEENFQSLIRHFDLQHDGQDSRLIDIAGKLLEESNSQRSCLDFDDMLYFPLKERVNFERFDYVFIDESQDTNQVQRELLRLLLSESSRLCAVGDKSQAIYGFRGADSNAMDEMKIQFKMTELPLSVSYRCSQAVVKEAQKWCDKE